MKEKNIAHMAMQGGTRTVFMAYCIAFHHELRNRDPRILRPTYAVLCLQAIILILFSVPITRF